MCSKICSSPEEVDDFYTKLKITPCPHCKDVGYLIKHGFLRGYDRNHYQLSKSTPSRLSRLSLPRCKPSSSESALALISIERQAATSHRGQVT